MRRIPYYLSLLDPAMAFNIVTNEFLLDDLFAKLNSNKFP